MLPSLPSLHPKTLMLFEATAYAFWKLRELSFDSTGREKHAIFLWSWPPRLGSKFEPALLAFRFYTPVP